MRIFKIEGQGNYAGGVFLVAAESAEQAADLGNELVDTLWCIKYKAEDAEEMKDLKYAKKGPAVILHYESGE